jgi:hypothetical protein
MNDSPTPSEGRCLRRPETIQDSATPMLVGAILWFELGRSRAAQAPPLRCKIIVMTATKLYA